jgi:hypothetical protein
MSRLILLSSLFLLGLFSSAFATKLVKVQVIDNQYIMVYFKDGMVVYRDDGTGPSAYTGHDYAEGDSELLAFGEELNVDIASLPESWTILSHDDQNYTSDGKQPVEVHRKAKVNNTDHDWKYKLDHWIFLKLPHPLKQEKSYQLLIDHETKTDVTNADFTRDIFNNLSEAVHVNMIGYTPKSPVKSADLYMWMGDGGPRDYNTFEGNKVWLYDVNTGIKHLVNEVSFWKKSDTEAEGRNLIGSDVWNVDFSAFTKPGAYRLVVDEVGCSREFVISENIYFEPYKTSVRGYYFMRIGEDEMNMEPIPRRPLFVPGENPEGFTIFITDLDPFDEAWDDHPGDTWDEPHFKPAKESMFWKRRLPGNPTNPVAKGGHSDALDWDRHLAHVSNIYDLLLPYFLSNGELNEDNLNIAESGNGIPDIIDEARNEVDLWLSLRHGDAYAHGLTNPSSEKTYMFQAGITTMAAWANAANCAMIGDCFRISGHKDLMEYYKKEAIKAFNFADHQDNQQLDDFQDIGNAGMRGRDFKMMAAAFLYNLTGDTQWEDILATESVAKNESSDIEKKEHWTQIWGTAGYMLTPQKRNYPDLYMNMKASVSNQAMEHNVKYMNRRPSRRSSNNNWWQTAQNLHLVILAHAISNDEKDKELYEKAMVLEADYGLGRNPSNIVEMTGLGERNIFNCYTSGRNDGFPGLHPGHTPYNNLEPWGTTHNGGNPRWFSEKGYPDWDEGGWPHQEAHFNCRYSWANGEFTPRQTMRGKMALYGYLYSLSK